MNLAEMRWLAILLAIPTGFSCFAAPPDTVWTRTYGGSNNDIGYSISPCMNGGFISAGYTYSFGSGPQSVYLVRIDDDGDTLWSRAFGGASYDGAHCVIETIDTCYLVAGYTESYGSGGKDMYILKVDQNGDTIWTRTYGGSLQDCAYAVCPAYDGGYIVAGYRDGPAGWTKGDLWLLRITENGDTLGSKSYGGAGEDFAISVCQTMDSNYALCGARSFQSAGGKDVWLLKINACGDTIWTRTYGGAAEDVGYDVNTSADGGLGAVGYINGTGQWTAGDLYIIKTDLNGDPTWSRVYGSPGQDFGKDLLPTPDQGFVIAGQTGFGSGANDMWLVRTDADGDTVWTRTYGGSADDVGLGLCPSGDGGWMLAGYTFSFGSGNADFYVVRTGPESGISGGLKSGLRLRGRPASIVVDLSPLLEDGSCSIYNVYGQIIDASDPGPGIYFIKGGDTAVQKVIKVR